MGQASENVDKPSSFICSSFPNVHNTVYDTHTFIVIGDIAVNE